MSELNSNQDMFDSEKSTDNKQRSSSAKRSKDSGNQLYAGHSGSGRISFENTGPFEEYEGEDVFRTNFTKEEAQKIGKTFYLKNVDIIVSNPYHLCMHAYMHVTQVVCLRRNSCS